MAVMGFRKRHNRRSDSSEFLRSSGTVLVLASHALHEKNLLRQLRNSGEIDVDRVVFVRRLRIPTVLARLRNWVRWRVDPARSDVLVVPSLKVNNLLLDSNTNQIRRNSELIFQHCPNISWIVVGERYGELAHMALNLRPRARLGLCFVPEGQSFFRNLEGPQYSAVSRLHSSTMLASLRDLISPKSRRYSGVTGLISRSRRVLWLLEIFAHSFARRSSILGYPPHIAHCEVLISEQGSALPQFFQADRRINPIKSVPPSEKVLETGRMLILHSPIEIDTETWKRLLKSLRLEPRTVVLSSHRNSAGLGPLREAIHAVFPAEFLEIPGSRPVEEVFESERFEWVVGIASTALIVALNGFPKSEIISFARAICEITPWKEALLSGDQHLSLLANFAATYRDHIRFPEL